MSTEYRVIVFVVIGVWLIWLSRQSLKRTRSHGFYRVFAWLAITALILLQLPHWFADPLGIQQLISWLLLAISAFLVVAGTLALHRLGKPNKLREDPTLLGIERTTVLVTSGVFSRIRHPLYSSLLFLTWGSCLKHVSWPAVTLALFASLLLTATAICEEAENLEHFGQEYRAYMATTKRFIPFVF